MPPEILKGEPHDFSVDIWSLGVLLYELIVGIPPFNEENPKEVIDRILRRDILEWWYL